MPGKRRSLEHSGKGTSSAGEWSCRWIRTQSPSKVRPPPTLSTVASRCPGSCSVLSEILRDRLPVDDPRGDEDQQLLAVIALGGASEEEAQEGKLAKEGDHRGAARTAAHVDAANHRGIAILDQYLGVGFLALDRRLTVGSSVCWVRLVVLGADVHHHAAVLGNVRRHFQREPRLNERSIDAGGRGLAEGDGNALADSSRGVI